MKKITTFILIGIFNVSYSQQVQFASKLIQFSSDLGGKQNSIKRILGKPDAFPQAGSSPNAWSPKNALDGREIVEVGFEKPQSVKQIAVFENLNAGCVVKVSVDNGNGKYETVWNHKKDWNFPKYKMTLASDRSYYFKRKRRKIEEAPEEVNPGIANVILENAVANVVAIKVEFNFGLVPGQKQIDAIAISDSDAPIEAKINSNELFENLPKPDFIVLGSLNPSNPIVSFDGKQLYFTERSQEKEVIYTCKKNAEGKWFNPTEENSALSLNPNYNYILAHQPNFILKGGMPYIRNSTETGIEFLDSNFNSMGQLKIAAYNNYDDNCAATITSDLKTVLMGIETDMTQGGTDLYFSNKKEDGTYGYLQNMGKAVNSAADEGMPFLLSDHRTLFFASNGFSGFGNYDIYVTQRLDETWKKWSEPINLGGKINSADYEGSPFYDEKTETLYFIKNINEKTLINYVKLSFSNMFKN